MSAVKVAKTFYDAFLAVYKFAHKSNSSNPIAFLFLPRLAFLLSVELNALASFLILQIVAIFL
jgi:hypothetical protein